ncbi:L,D-transpeptidase family protein [Bacteroides sp. OttesenSCG-928-J23]|nr:L,D-transpeptidase family protein [Bacteroides sp. OttesenSCG-928-J23]MDL2303784.1 L,D-transpeptidase family protein [Bacteroides sp. OttesenSCG-928-D19]
MKQYNFLLVLLILLVAACTPRSADEPKETLLSAADTIEAKTSETPPRLLTGEDIILKKDLTYHSYTLDDTYPYKDTVREFRWNRIKALLAVLENLQPVEQPWAILQNRRNINGEAPLVPNWSRNEYKNVADSLGVERFQGIPLYLPTDSGAPVRYGRDGELVRLTKNSEDSQFIEAQTVFVPGDFMIPRKYVKFTDTIRFERVAFVDRTNQNIATLERTDSLWLIRSMNPATTGKHNPPYANDTPEGIFVIQEKKTKMYYLVDGTSKIAGFAPWASRFTNGGYIHGVPVNNPNGKIIEYSSTLGTIPRSHMCVRNASSHAEYIFQWAETGRSLVIVLD